MTDKELHKLGKRELLEILLAMSDEIDELKAENDRLRGLSDTDGLSMIKETNERVKRLYIDRFGEDLAHDDEKADETDEAGTDETSEDLVRQNDDEQSGSDEA
ncbi:MAG: hypothetical protein LUE12_06020 [Ruminococcus sp.]|nr:hypothetical protein [Ruminococcus sp.]